MLIGLQLSDPCDMLQTYTSVEVHKMQDIASLAHKCYFSNGESENFQTARCDDLVSIGSTAALFSAKSHGLSFDLRDVGAGAAQVFAQRG